MSSVLQCIANNVFIMPSFILLLHLTVKDFSKSLNIWPSCEKSISQWLYSEYFQSSWLHRCNHHKEPVGRIPSNCVDHGTKCIWFPPTFATGCHFRWALGSLQCFPRLLCYIQGEKERREGNGWNLGGAVAGDGEGAEEEKKVDRHPTHLRSRPTLQLWLHLWQVIEFITVHSVCSSGL